MHARFLAWCLDRDCGWASRSLPTEAAARDVAAAHAGYCTGPTTIGEADCNSLAPLRLTQVLYLGAALALPPIRVQREVTPNGGGPSEPRRRRRD